MGLARLVFRLGRLGSQILEIAHSMPPETPIQTRARDISDQERSNHGQQIIQRNEQCLAQIDSNRFLSQDQRRSQPVRRIAAVMNALTMPPFVGRLLGRAEPLHKHRRGLATSLDFDPPFRPRRRLRVKMDRHARTPFRMSLSSDLAMKIVDRRGSI